MVPGFWGLYVGRKEGTAKGWVVCEGKAGRGSRDHESTLI